MMAEDESFKVTDRRGRPREESEEASSTDPRPSLTGSPRAETRSASPPEAPRGPDLQSLFVMFASSALISLGEAADPSTGERHVDLDQARDAIDMLALLRDKTSGNRTEEENRLLEQIMYDLQIRFVRVAESGRPR
jgi:Domain of unknown function (DUF1844)